MRLPKLAYCIGFGLYSSFTFTLQWPYNIYKSIEGCFTSEDKWYESLGYVLYNLFTPITYFFRGASCGLDYFNLQLDIEDNERAKQEERQRWLDQKYDGMFKQVRSEYYSHCKAWTRKFPVYDYNDDKSEEARSATVTRSPSPQ